MASQRLRDEATERESEHVYLGEAERVDESEHVAGHVLHVVRNHARRGAYAPVVEQHDLALACEPVDENGIPRVEIPAEVLQEKQRRRPAVGVAEAPVHERCTVDLHRPIRGDQRALMDH